MGSLSHHTPHASAHHEKPRKSLHPQLSADQPTRICADHLPGPPARISADLDMVHAGNRRRVVGSPNQNRKGVGCPDLVHITSNGPPGNYTTRANPARAESANGVRIPPDVKTHSELLMVRGVLGIVSQTSTPTPWESARGSGSMVSSFESYRRAASTLAGKEMSLPQRQPDPAAMELSGGFAVGRRRGTPWLDRGCSIRLLPGAPSRWRSHG